MRRKHLKIKLWGCYLLALIVFLCYAGVFQAYNTISVCLEMRIVGSMRLEWEHHVYIMYFLSFATSVCQIVAGCLGIRCYTCRPSEKALKSFALLLGIVQLLILGRDIMWNNVGISTFTYIHRTMLIVVLTKIWKKSYSGRDAENINKYFPFIMNV